MINCNQKNCDKDATVQFDHCGKLSFDCDEHWQAYKNIMNAMGSPIPVCYPVGVKPIE